MKESTLAAIIMALLLGSAAAYAIHTGAQHLTAALVGH